MKSFKEFMIEGAKEDLYIAQATSSLVSGISNYAKRTFTTSVFKELERRTVTDNWGGIAQLFDNKEDKFEIIVEEGYLTINFFVHKFLKDHDPDSRFDPRSRLFVSFQPQIAKYTNGHNVGGDYRRHMAAMRVFVTPKFMEFNQDNVKNFWKVVNSYSRVIAHELTHHIDNYRSGGKAWSDKSSGLYYRGDLDGYFNSTHELNAFYQEAVYVTMDMISRMIRIKKISDGWPTAKDFVNSTLTHDITGVKHLDSNNRKRLIRRLYKLYDELSAMSEDEFLQFKKSGMAKRWVNSHMQRIQNL